MPSLIKIIVSLLLLALSGCVPNTSHVENMHQNTMHIGTEQFPSSLDSGLEWNGWFTVRYGIGETLFTVDDQMVLQPCLAEAVDFIDAYTWRITLRSDVKFSDGSLMDVESVRNNLQRVAQVNPRASFLKDATYDIDGNQLTIHTTSMCVTLPSELSDPMFSILNLSSSNDKDSIPVGTGPYQVQSFTADKDVTLIPNTYYWNGQPKVNEITVSKVLEKETALLALENHELDAYTDINPQGIQQLQNNNDFTIQSIPSSRVYSLYLNPKTLQDSTLRQAIAIAIDKDTIANHLLEGNITPTYSPFPSDSMYAYEADKNIYNLDQAKQLLKDAGYVDTNNDGYIDIDGKNINLRISYYKRLSLEAIATQLQSTLKKLGIQSEVNVYESSGYLETKDYDLGLYSMVTMPTGDPAYYFNALLADGGSVNYIGSPSEQLQQLLDQLNTTSDTEARSQISMDIQKLYLPDNFVIYIGFENLNFAMDSHIKNFVPHETDYYQITKDLEIDS